jgi:hypothetical protein
MGRAKEQFINATGGILFGENEAGFLSRQSKAQALTKKLVSGVPVEQRDGLIEEIQRLQGIPSAEWDYGPND